MQTDMYYDTVIAGCGVAGLYAALKLPASSNILMICKESMEECDSMLAQGESVFFMMRTITLHILRIPCVPVIMKITQKVWI